jgi:hypothetical protein
MGRERDRGIKGGEKGNREGEGECQTMPKGVEC